MCTGVELTVGQALMASAAVSAAGAYMQAQAAEDANNERQAILRAAQESDAKLNEQRASKVENFAQDNLAVPVRLQRYDKAATTREGELTKALQDANGGSVNSGGYGKVSEDYTRKNAEETVAAANDIMRRAKADARSSASGGMFAQEASLGGDLSSSIAGITSQMNRNDRYARTALKGVNDSGSLVGGLLSGASGAVAGMGKKK